MKINVYSARDLYGTTYDGLYLAPTDGAVCRLLSQVLAQQKQSQNEITIFRVGTFDNESGAIQPTAPVAVPWSAYRQPEIQSQPLSPAGSSGARLREDFVRATDDVAAR